MNPSNDIGIAFVLWRRHSIRGSVCDFYKYCRKCEQRQHSQKQASNNYDKHIRCSFCEKCVRRYLTVWTIGVGQRLVLLLPITQPLTIVAVGGIEPPPTSDVEGMLPLHQHRLASVSSRSTDYHVLVENYGRCFCCQVHLPKLRAVTAYAATLSSTNELSLSVSLHSVFTVFLTDNLLAPYSALVRIPFQPHHKYLS